MILARLVAILLVAFASCGFTHGGGFNGGKSQINLGFLSSTPDVGFYFINHFKTAQIFACANGSAGYDPGLEDSNGYPTSIACTGALTAFAIESQIDRPGDWVVTADGSGTFSITGITGTTTFSGGGSLTIPQANLTGVSQMTFAITATSASPNNLRNIKVYHSGDAALVAAGKIFEPKFLSTLQLGGFSVIRFLNWYAGTSQVSNETIWATRKTQTYYSYAASEFRASLYVLPANVTYSGTSTGGCTNGVYSVTDARFSVAENTTIQFKVPTTANGNVPCLNLNSGSNIPLVQPDGNVFSATTVPTIGGYGTAIYKASLNSWLLWGGAELSADNTHGLENGVPPEVMFELCLETGTYPWLEVPYLAADPVSDYVPSEVAYFLSLNATWMVPRWEVTPNELWNYGYAPTTYADKVGAAYWGDGAGTGYSDFAGKVGSTVGQAINIAFGNTGKGTKYRAIVGVQTSPVFDATSTPGAPADYRLTSNGFVNQAAAPQSPYTKSAAYNWVTDFALTNYFTPCERGTAQEIIDGYNYNVTDGGNATAQLALTDSYTTTLNGACVSGVSGLATNQANAKAWGAGMAVPVGMTAYEGGPQGVALVFEAFGNISGASKATSAVLTIATASTDTTAIGGGTVTGNPMVVGMQLAISSVVGMTQLNGATGTMGEPTGFVTVTGVSSNNVTIDVNSTGFTTYVSGGAAAITGISADIQALRMSFRQSGLLTNYIYQIYSNFVAAGGTLPSQLDLVDACSVSQCWGAFTPNFYAIPSPAFGGMIRWNH